MDALKPQSHKTMSLSLSSSLKHFLIENEDVDELPTMDIAQMSKCLVPHISQARWGKNGF